MRRTAIPVAAAVLFLLACTMALIPQNSSRKQPVTEPAANQPPLSAREMVQRAMEHDVANWKLEEDYTFVQRIEEREINADGSVKSDKSDTEEIVFLYGQPYAHLIKHNDQPLSDADAKKAEKKLNETMEKRRSETPEERQRRLADWNKRHEEEHSFLLEVPEAYDFKLEGEETLNGRSAYVISGQPRANFRPTLNAARVLPKLRPKIWIDKDGYQWLKLQADVVDTITWGGFLLRLHPGSHIELEQTLVNSEIWLPLRAHISFDARVALFKAIRMDIDAQFSDYKKFRTDSKIISVQEVQH